MTDSLQTSFDTILESSPPSIRQIIAENNGMEDKAFEYSDLFNVTKEGQIASLLGISLEEMSSDEHAKIERVIKYLKRKDLMNDTESGAKAIREIEFEIGKPPRGNSRLDHVSSYVRLQDQLVSIHEQVEDLRRDALRSIGQ